MAVKAAAGLGQLYPAGAPFKELCAKGFFQLLDSGRKRRLGHEDALGSLGEAAGFGNGQKVADLVKIHWN